MNGVCFCKAHILLMQNSGELRGIEHALLAAKWCQTFTGNSSFARCDANGQSRPANGQRRPWEKKHAGEEEEDNKAEQRVFVFNF